MKLSDYITTCYSIATEKGFYSDDKTIDDHIMGVLSEFTEAYEADRNDRKADFITYSTIMNGKNPFMKKRAYKEYISGSFEDELADKFIRMFNLCGHYVDSLNYDVIDKSFNNFKPYYKTNSLSELSCELVFTELKEIRQDIKEGYTPIMRMVNVIVELYHYCKRIGIDIVKFIDIKIEFNRTREHLHGKRY